MSVTQITTHQADALARLLSQYQGKPLFAGLLNSLTQNVQELENAFFTMLTGRSIYAATGAQLDAIGQVVGLKRNPSWGDTEYQGLLLAEIGVNTSQGSPEQVISVFKSMTLASHVDYREYYPCEVWLFSNAQIDPSLVTTLYHFCNAIIPAGVRLGAFGYYDATNAFTLAGDSTGAGFDDGSATVGGKLAVLYAPAVPQFAFAGDDTNPDVTGFGDRLDPVVGGQLNNP